MTNLNDEINILRNSVNNFKTGEQLLAEQNEADSKNQLNLSRQETVMKNAERVNEFKLEGANVLQLGLDKTGIEMQEVLINAGASVLTFDAFSENSDYISEDDIVVEDFDLICVTRWFSPKSPVIKRAVQADVLIFSELQLAQKVRVNNSKTNELVNWILIAGTNGKTQVKRLTKSILKEAGFKVNQKESILKAATNPELDFVVIEADSFNLEFSLFLQPAVSALLNISVINPAWHGSEEKYAEALKKVYDNTSRICVFNADDFAVDSAVQEAEVVEGARAVGFTHHAPSRSQIGFAAEILADRAFYEDNNDILRYLKAQEIVNFSNLKNLHNKQGRIPTYTLQNLAAAVAITRSFGVNAWQIYNAVSNFELSENMNELVWSRDLSKESKLGFGQIDYVCDTNSKTPGATLGTVCSYPEKSVVLIMVAQNAINYSSFLKKASAFVANIIIIGEETDVLVQNAKESAPGLPRFVIKESVETGIEKAFIKANELVFENQFIILSPSTTVNEINFTNDDLANCFKDLVNELKEDCKNKGKLAGIVNENS